MSLLTIPPFVCGGSCSVLNYGSAKCDHEWKTWTTDIDFYGLCIKCGKKIGCEVYT